MINVQLLSAVLGVEVISFELKQKNKIDYKYNKPSKNEWFGKDFCNRSINLYELANKCKEWAFNKSYSLESAKRNILGDKNKILSTWICCGFNPFMEVLPNFEAETEPEAIFKACNWIIDNKDIK